jgi:hypothetical protein
LTKPTSTGIPYQTCLQTCRKPVCPQPSANPSDPYATVHEPIQSVRNNLQTHLICPQPSATIGNHLQTHPIHLQPSATICNHPQPSATIRNHLQPSANLSATICKPI